MQVKMEHSTTHSTFNNLPIVIKTLVSSIFEWPFYTGFILCVIAPFIQSQLSFIGHFSVGWERLLS